MTNATRLLVWLLGLLIVLGAIWALYATTGLADVVPSGVVVAVILLVLGLGVMGAASQMGTGPSPATVAYREPRGYDPAAERRAAEERRYRDEDRY